MKSWLTDGRGIATLIAVSLLAAALTGCARSEQSLACAKLQRGQWVKLGDRVGVVVTLNYHTVWVQIPGAGFAEKYPCEALQ